MEPRDFNTFKFFREYFRIPQRIALQWCVVKEASSLGTELRLGVLLKGTDLYIDVAMRRFFHQIDSPAVRRLCFPACRKDCGSDYEYRTEEGWRFIRSKRYIRDIYFTSIYHKDFSKARLY